jgi:hypothetical protein
MEKGEGGSEKKVISDIPQTTEKGKCRIKIGEENSTRPANVGVRTNEKARVWKFTSRAITASRN